MKMEPNNLSLKRLIEAYEENEVRDELWQY